MAEPAEEQELSPEEKLLKVIQGGDSDEDKAAGAEPAPEAAPGAEPPPAEKPKLKLAEEPAPSPPEGEAAAEGEEDKGEAAAEGEEDKGEEAKKGKKKGKKKGRKKDAAGRKAAGTGSSAASGPGKRMPSEVGTGIRIANRFLLIVILVLLCLCGFEIWNGALATTEAPPPSDGATPSLTPDDFVLPDVALLRMAFRQKKIWDIGEEVTPGPGPRPTPTPPGPRVDKVMRLIGTSAPRGAPPEDVTAVILDNRDSKMHFLKMGEKLPFNDHEFTVNKVALDHVVLTEGDVEVTIQ